MTSIYTIRDWDDSDPYREYKYKNYGLYSRKPDINDLEAIEKIGSLYFYGTSNLVELLTTGKTGTDRRGFEIVEMQVIDIDVLTGVEGSIYTSNFWS